MENSLLAGSPGSEVVPTGPNGEGLPGSPTRRRCGSPRHEPRARPWTSRFNSRSPRICQPADHRHTRHRAEWRSSRTGGRAASWRWSTSSPGRTARSLPPTRTCAATSVYQPGSVMKLVTMSGALAGRADHARARSSRCLTRSRSAAGPSPTPTTTRPSGSRATQILAQSSNIGTIRDRPPPRSRAPLVLPRGTSASASRPGSAGQARPPASCRARTTRARGPGPRWEPSRSAPERP